MWQTASHALEGGMVWAQRGANSVSVQSAAASYLAVGQLAGHVVELAVDVEELTNVLY